MSVSPAIMPINTIAEHRWQVPSTAVIKTASGVVVLHVCIMMALLAMSPLTTPPPKVTPPLVIQYLQSADPKAATLAVTAPAAEAIKSRQPNSEPTPDKPRPQSPTVAKTPAATHTPTKTAPRAPTTEPSPVSSRVTPAATQSQTRTIPSKPSKPIIPSTSAPSESGVAVSVLSEQTRDTITQSRLAQQQEQQRQAQAAAHEQAVRDQAAQEKAAQEKAAKEQQARDQAAQEKLAQEKLAQERAAAQTTPVSFGNGEARWRSRPNTRLPENLARLIEEENLSHLGVRLTVSAAGNVTAVTITQSSGNRLIDNTIRQRLQSAKLQPFIRNGVAVAGIGNLTINLR